MRRKNDKNSEQSTSCFQKLLSAAAFLSYRDLKIEFAIWFTED